MKSPLDHAWALLRKANNDLIAGQAILATGQATDMVCFHAQQAAEKSLKSLLALHDVEYPKRHDLGELFELTVTLVPEIREFEERVISLSPFAVQVRYDVEFTPSVERARGALDTATAFYALCRSLIESENVKPE